MSTSALKPPLLTVLCASLLGCSSTVAPSGRDGADAAPVDASSMDVPPEATVREECRNVRECAGRQRPEGSVFGRTWSCVLGRCTWEPRGGQTCFDQPDGCTRCDATEVACPGTRCAAPLDPSSLTIESTNCMRDFVRSVRSCSGPIVRLNDGTPCLVVEAPTGALRYVLSCGTCEVVFSPR